MKTFGGILREAIRAKGMSLDATAKASGTYKGYISGICNRKLNPPSEKLTRKLCKILGLDLNEMLARSAFEKFPSGIDYGVVQRLIDEAQRSGLSEAPKKKSG